MGLRDWFVDTLSVYGAAARRAAELTATNWPVIIAPMTYALIITVVSALLAPLGPMIGSFLLYFVELTCWSAWLAILANVIENGRIRFVDLQREFASYLGDLLNILFILWGVRLAGDLALAQNPPLYVLYYVALFVFLNVVPELIYLGRIGGLDLVTRSYGFVIENWIEWFPPTILGLAAWWLASGLAMEPGARGILAEGVAGAIWLYVWLFRGLLFKDLGLSSRRSRAFRRLAGR